MSSIRFELAAPSLAGVVDGQLDPESVPESGAIASVLEVLPAWNGKTLTLFLRDDKGTVLDEQDWPIGPHGLPISLPIPKSVLMANIDKDVVLDYSITDIGTSNPLAFKLGQGFSGAVEFDLAEHNYMVAYTHSEARPPEQLPAFTRMQRALPGATGYSSSDETVARVDNLGVVTAQGNGQASITASGAPSGPSSYTLTVKGIREFHVLSNAADWSGAETLCNQVGLTLPTTGDFSRLKLFYPLPIGFYLNLPDYPVWGAFLGAGTAYTFDLNSGDTESSDTSSLLQVVGVLRG